MMDSKLRNYLLITSVGLVISGGSCASQNLYGRVTKLEDRTMEIERVNSSTTTEIKEFRKSFEEFKDDYKKTHERHHR